MVSIRLSVFAVVFAFFVCATREREKRVSGDGHRGIALYISASKISIFAGTVHVHMYRTLPYAVLQTAAVYDSAGNRIFVHSRVLT